MAKTKEEILEYDSRNDTLIHILIVEQMLLNAAQEFVRRAQIHDQSKLEPPEKELFDEFTPKLAETTYGSDEYNHFLKDLGFALSHHYENNSHHPEHYENGVEGMNLFDLMEMFFDWWAATKRHNDGNILKSIELNQGRFGLHPQIVSILRNTVDYCRKNLNDPNFMILSK